MTAKISILGAGAFGTALGIALAQGGHTVALWGRDAAQRSAMRAQRENTARLPGVDFPASLEISETPAKAPITLLATPTQTLRQVLGDHQAALQNSALVACCKGVELGTGLLPTQVIDAVLPGARRGVLTGPSFAIDIAQGKPSALTLAFDGTDAARLQAALAAPALRPYLTDDIIGAQVGGALKNVIAIAAGVAMGAGLGESTRASVITRGFAEIMVRAQEWGARADTLTGLSGFGDLVLTCTSDKSRNYRYGVALGQGQPPTRETVEGAATARALAQSPQNAMPIAQMVAALIDGRVTPAQAQELLLNRPLKRE